MCILSKNDEGKCFTKREHMIFNSNDMLCKAVEKIADNGNMKIYCRRCDQTFRLYSFRDSIIKIRFANEQTNYVSTIDCPWCDKNDRLMFFEKEYDKSSMSMREEL